MDAVGHLGLPTATEASPVAMNLIGVRRYRGLVSHTRLRALRKPNFCINGYLLLHKKILKKFRNRFAILVDFRYINLHRGKRPKAQEEG